VAAVFHEVLHLRRGPAGWTLLLVAAAGAALSLALFDAPWSVIGVAVGFGLATVTWFAGTETTITTDELRLALRPLPRARRFPLADVARAEIVLADANTSYFGGWKGSRGGLGGAVVESIEGPRQIGNRSIRVELVDGRTVQFATWRPREALAAIDGR